MTHPQPESPNRQETACCALLASLKAVLNHDNGHLPQDVHDMAVEAIRRAEGRS